MNLQVEIREQVVVVHVPDSALTPLADVFGVVPGKEKQPYTNGLNFFMHGNRITLRSHDPMRLATRPFSPLRKTAKLLKQPPFAHCFVFSYVAAGARSAPMAVNFEVNKKLRVLVGVVPSNNERPWPEFMGDSAIFPPDVIARREIRARAPIRLARVPDWAQAALTPFERNELSQKENLP